MEPQVSLYAWAGVPNADTVRLWVCVIGHKLLAMVDSGSTNNFIKADVAHCLRMHL